MGLAEVSCSTGGLDVETVIRDAPRGLLGWQPRVSGLLTRVQRTLLFMPPAQHVGIAITFGRAHVATLDPGLHLTNPFASDETFSTKTTLIDGDGEHARGQPI